MYHNKNDICHYYKIEKVVICTYMIKEKKDDYLEEDREGLINSLLDIENYYGESDSRIAPTLVTILLLCIPPFIYFYYLFGIIPIWFFLLPYVFYAIRVLMIILGEERKRLMQYEKQLYDVYSSVEDLLGIHKFHDNGCVEYTNGIIKFFIIADNSYTENPVHRAQKIRGFYITASEDYIVDVYSQNTLNTEDLYDRYSYVSKFTNPEVEKDFIEMIDYNRKYISESSLVTRTIFVVTARKTAYISVQKAVQAAVHSDEAKVFKELRVAGKQEAMKIVSDDLSTYIDYEEINRKKYSTGKYYGSKVLAYDVGLRKTKEDMDIKEYINEYQQEKKQEEIGFLIKDEEVLNIENYQKN